MTKISETDKESDKEMADRFYKLYIECLNYKRIKYKKSKKIINCDNYYDKFKYFNEKL